MSKRRVIRDGKVAVLWSPGRGAGWSTWNKGFEERLLFDPDIVAAIEREDFGEAGRLAEAIAPDEIYAAPRKLQIAWLPVGTRFFVEEKDGSERIITEEDLVYVT